MLILCTCWKDSLLLIPFTHLNLNKQAPAERPVLLRRFVLHGQWRLQQSHESTRAWKGLHPERIFHSSTGQSQRRITGQLRRGHFWLHRIRVQISPRTMFLTKKNWWMLPRTILSMVIYLKIHINECVQNKSYQST